MEYSYDDVTPVPLKADQPQLCQILYLEQFETTMGTLLALMQAKEYSERALALTAVGIELLASHYSIWVYRYNIITKLDHDLYEELDFLESIALDNEKNYQIWNYRQLIIERVIKTKGLYDYHREFPIIEVMLLEDAKNHHVWTYKKWVVARFDLYKDPNENKMIDAILENDVRNNSAWNHRFFLKFSQDKLITSDVMDEELEYVKLQIKRSPQNESSWSYLRGIIRKCGLELKTLESFCREFVDTTGDMGNDAELDLVKSSFALEILAEISDIKEAVKYYELLSERYDPIRKNYWAYLLAQRMGEKV